MTCLLALDTATERMAVAVARDELTRCLNAEGGAAASLHLIPDALGLLAGLGLAVSDLDAIAFGQGPGAFTGLRTAVSVAQGLAYGAGKPVLAIDSLMIVAEDARSQQPAALGPQDGQPGPLLWVLMDARMDEIYGAAYRCTLDGWRVDVPPALWDLPGLQACWREHGGPDWVAGNALTAFGERLPLPAAAAATGLGVGQIPQVLDRAAALLRLARAAWQAGQTLPADQALPVYLRDKVAQTTAERAAAKAALAPT